jgi:hypothetical protein
MLAHMPRNTFSCGIRSRNIAGIANMTATACLIDAKIIRPNYLAIALSDKNGITGAKPI